MLFFPVWKGAFYAWCAQVPQRARAFHADCASNELKEVEIMTITVSGRKMPVTDALRQYPEETVGNAIKAVDADTVSTEIVLYTEKNPANPLPAICEVTVRVKGHIVREDDASLIPWIDKNGFETFEREAAERRAQAEAAAAEQQA